ncbi:hypothetical protein [Maribacter flavus]|uniref:Uncharacterized protein n=1 Tax=Maribacter flavus TaxID=1658664 RepID=A0A5B2TS57_9FLAO|nr:hypothetical protein [Maribacter flavus]KAA2216728.1 hypothetical protein F0361_12090 [Maribacter flavus]
MNKFILITSILFLTTSKSFCQNETRLLGFNDFNSNSFAFIEFIKNHPESDDLTKWYEGKINERLTKNLNELNQIAKKYPQKLEITVIPFGDKPEKNNPLFIIYRLVDIKENIELSILLRYAKDGNLLIDGLEVVNLTELLKDSIRNPPPEPPNRN